MRAAVASLSLCLTIARRLCYAGPRGRRKAKEVAGGSSSRLQAPHARTVFWTNQHQTYEVDELVQLAYVADLEPDEDEHDHVDAGEHDFFWCRHAFDKRTDTFQTLDEAMPSKHGKRRRQADAAAEEGYSSDQSSASSSDDDDDCSSDDVSADESDNDVASGDEGAARAQRHKPEPARDKSRARKRSVPRVGGKRTQGGDAWTSQRSAIDVGVLAPSQAARAPQRETPVAAAQRLLTLSSRPDKLPCRDDEKQVCTVSMNCTNIHHAISLLSSWHDK